MTLERLGKGFAFPIIPDPLRGAVSYRAGAEKVRESIELILRTEPGERIMRPTFGCGLRQYLMELNTVATRADIQRSVTEAIESFEPRVIVNDVLVVPGDDPSLVTITIRYEHQRDGTEGLLVYPFYLEQ